MPNGPLNDQCCSFSGAWVVAASAGAAARPKRAARARTLRSIGRSTLLFRRGRGPGGHGGWMRKHRRGNRFRRGQRSLRERQDERRHDEEVEEVVGGGDPAQPDEAVEVGIDGG